MVIVVEEKNTNAIGMGRIISWAVLLVLAGVGAYYVFFEAPTIVEYSVPPDFPDTDQFMQIKERINPEDINTFSIIQDKKFIEPPHASPEGRYNPFLPY